MYLPNWCANLMRGTNLEGVLLVPLLDRLGIPATLTAPWRKLEHWRAGGFLRAMKAPQKDLHFGPFFWDTLRRWLETLGTTSGLL